MVDRYQAMPHDEIQDEFRRLGLPNGTVLDTEMMGPRGSLEPAVHIFDCLAWNGEWLSDVPFEERWAKCQQFNLNNFRFLRLSETIYPSSQDKTNRILQWFAKLKKEWQDSGGGITYCEGVVIKLRRGRMIFDFKHSKKSPVQWKLKFREGREKRF